MIIRVLLLCLASFSVSSIQGSSAIGFARASRMFPPPPSGRAYLNEGNRAFLEGRLPEAILSYRRAERFIPRNDTLKANLADARSRVLDPPPGPSSRWPSWLARPRPSAKTRLALTAYAIGWTLLGVWLWKRGYMPWISAGVFFVIALVLFANVYVKERDDTLHPLTIISVDGTILRRGNGESYPAHEINRAPVKLNRGVETRARAQRKNGWVQIELANGMIGWVPGNAVLLDHELPE